MKSIVKRISNLFGSIVLVAMVLAGGLSVPMTAAAGPAMCPATLDIALVFDRSASMGYDNPDPIQPLTDAQDATVAFIDMLDGDDKVALVDFAEGAIITNPLTFDHAAVKASVELDELKKWTNTGAGIDAGHEELTGPNGRGGVKKVIILLSDGNPTKPSNESYAATYALGKADDAKADGIVIYTIGVGSSTSATSTLFMQGVASEDSNYYYAPTLEELEDAYEEIASEVCEPDTVTLIASKVVCENESLLPDLSGQSVNITDSTANDYVAAIQGCSLESGWSFQWGDQNVSDPGGDHYGEANVSGWTTFGLTNVDGVVSTEIDISGMTQIRVREVLQSGYIPFTYPPTDDAESAEFYCSGDVLHYDNFDFVTNLTADETYYCVAFNAPEATYECSDGIDNDGDGLTDYPNDLGCDCFDDDDENDRPVITVDPTSITLTVGDSFDPYNGHATADDAEDGDITGSLTASSSVDTATVGTYYVDYDVVDSDGAAADTKTLTVNVVSEPPHYGPYCGDGIVQPELMEQCDTGHLVGGDPIVGCSVQCQIMGAPVCSEDVFARAVVTDVQNFQEDADMTEDIFLGTSTLPIPSWAWFPVYYDGSYINDDSIEGYEDVPGLAVQRDNGSITVRHYGSHPSPSDGTKEHVEGYLEFYNAGVLGIENDDASGNNQMENWGPDMVAEKSLSAGKDAAWSATTTSNFWMTVTIADDSYFTTYALPPECEDDPELITIVATKIVCENESDLPNWGAVQTPIDENTAADFLNDNEYCSIATGWQFQWAPKVTGNPGDNTGEAGGDWTTFIESTEIELSELPEGVDDYVWVREVWNEEYIPFTGANTTENESAEIYCHIDTINYDNYDRVDGITEGGIYYCVAFNVPVEVPPQCVIEGYKYDYDTGEGIADWTIGLAEINTCQNDDDAWADFVVEYNPVGDIMLDRIDPNQALGVAERSQGYDFVSLGLDHIGGPPGGELILGFDNLILNGEGDDLEVVETSWGDPSCQDYSETVQVYASQDGTTWEYLGQTCLDGTFDLGSLPWAQYVKIVDVTVDTRSSDGYDVDGVRALYCGYDYNIVQTTTTDIDGAYCFDDVADGDYVVYEMTVGTGWHIQEVYVNGSLSLFHTDSFFDVFVDVRVEGNLVTVIDFYNQTDAPVNHAPEITLATSTIYLTVGDAFDPMDGHATTTDIDGDDVTLYASSTVDTNATGTYAVVYTAEDEHGAWAAPKTLTVIVGEDAPVNVAPTAIITGITTVTLGDPVMLSATSSYDTDGEIEGYYWDFDGATSSADTMSHTYSATGTYPVVLTVTDNDGATSTDMVEVTVGEGEPVDYPECSDGEDNDGDGTVDIDDLTCYRGGIYDPQIDDEENQKPVIMLINPTINLTVGSSFDPYGGHAAADDFEDGDITSEINATSTVNTSAVGTYTVDYGVEDSEGLAADPKVFTVIVTQVSGGGGGGGGGYISQILSITNEKVQYLGGGEATVTWTTNLLATSQVVYGDESLAFVGTAPSYGYDSMNVEDTSLKTSHSMTITGLEDGKQYWFRPVSDRSFSVERYGKEVTYLFITVPKQCNYLLEYIQLGAANNPVEVEKLEVFLNDFEGENLEVNGIYEQADFDAVLRFQTKYFSDILGPWGHDAPTGYVYITTKKKINELYCEREFPLTLFQETEIAAFNAFLGAHDGVPVGTEDVDFSNVVGLGDDEETEDTTLADAVDTEDEGSEEAESRGLLAGILNAFGFGSDDEDTSEKSDSTDLAEDAGTTTEDEIQGQGERNLAAVVFGGVISVATSYWFIFLLAVFAVILFLRIRGAEKG